jgi:hypothetical protein
VSRRLALALVLLALAGLVACPKPRDRSGRVVTQGSFRLRTFPAGAQVWIDGELKVESTPATLVLPEGRYHLKMQIPGAEAVERDIRIEAGEHKDFTYKVPTPPPATLTVHSDVEGARVRVNGWMRGRTPLEAAVTKPGPLDITVTTDDGRAKSLRAYLDVSEAKTLEVWFDREETTTRTSTQPEPMGPPRPGTLTLATKPLAEVLTSTGGVMGRTPIDRRRLPAGEHRLRLRSLDGRYQRRVTLSVESGRDAVYRFRLGRDDEVPGWTPDAGLASP